MNKLTIIGNLTKDPEIMYTQDKIPVCHFNVAVNERRPGKDGEKRVDYFRVSAWRGLGENCHKYLAKGKRVCVVGTIHGETIQSGNDKYFSLEVKAEEVEFLGGGSKNEPEEDDEMPM